MAVNISYLARDQILRRHRFQKLPFLSVHMSTGNNVYKKVRLWRRFWKDTMSIACARLSDSRTSVKIKRAVSGKGSGAPHLSPSSRAFIIIIIIIIIIISVGACSNNSLATRRGTKNLIYILAFILLKLLTASIYSTTPLLLLFSTNFCCSSLSIVAVLIAKAGHVWVSWPEEFLLYFLSLTLQQVCYCQGID